MSATEIGYAATEHSCYGIFGTEKGYGATRRLSVARVPTQGVSPISLRPCYAVSGTSLAYAAISLGPCYAMSGTDLAYGTMPCPCQRTGAISLRACYATSGTDLAVAAYAVCGTDLGYAATSFSLPIVNNGDTPITLDLRLVNYRPTRSDIAIIVLRYA
eukprot:1081141-Rhodomonas_salina.4